MNLPHVSNRKKLGEHGFQCASINKCDTVICNLKGALSKYENHFAINETFNCKSQDLKMFNILNAEQLPILQIVQLIFICFIM